MTLPGPSPQDGESPDEAQRQIARRLREAGLDSPALDARLLVQHVTGLDAAALLTAAGPLTEAQSVALEALVHRRLAREPIARLLGTREFYGLTFRLNDACLIPRPDSETLIDRALALTGESGRVLDLGTGPGTLLLAFLSRKPGWTGLGIDLSEKALDAARSNAQALGLSARAVFMQGCWFEGIAESFDLILANPPYIPSADCETLQEEVRRHDPRLALDGGTDGLAAYRAILATAPTRLRPGALVILEAGIGQAADIALLGERTGLVPQSNAPDLAGIPRAVILRGPDEKP